MEGLTDPLLGSDLAGAEIEVSAARKNFKWYGLLIGAAAGGLAGWASGSGLEDDECPYGGIDAIACISDRTAEEKRQSRTIDAASVGAGVGLLIGSAIKNDVWVPLPKNASALVLRPSVSGSGDRMVLGFSLVARRP